MKEEDKCMNTWHKKKLKIEGKKNNHYIDIRIN